MITAPHRSLATLRDIDWASTGSILTGCQPVYDAITTEDGLLDSLLTALPSDPVRSAMCERYDFLDKLVLYADGDIRVRLHRYRPGYFDRPHPHRWPFFAGIAHGGYLHRIFSTDIDVNEETNPRTLRPIIERWERPGSSYALDDTTVHTVQAEADTISILVRGPATSDRFLILDVEAGRSFWVYGAANETPQQRAKKQMTADQLTVTIAQVRAIMNLTSKDPQ